MKIEIMDTTLRDGEQTPGVAFSDNEKLNIARFLLLDTKVDRIEVASARISQGELAATRKICQWAMEQGMAERVEVLGFVDQNKSVDWLLDANAKVLNLLCKGSLNHVENQLRQTPETHINNILSVVAYAKEKGLLVNVYLEDWSNGMKHSPDYVYQLIESLRKEPVERFMLPDTLGILSPVETYDYCLDMKKRYPDLKFDFHAHNDYDFAVANTLMSVKAGVSGVHTTVNGLGERTGNAPLSSVVSMIKDHSGEIECQVDETKLTKVSKLVEAFSGIRIPANKPIIGESVFTQTCGVHADGDSKGNLYFNDLMPERFGRYRKYALGKTSGKASIVQNLRELGIELDKEAIAKVTKRIVELGDKKENINTDELPYIIADVLYDSQSDEKVKLNNYYICHANNLSPVATLSIKVNGRDYEETATGDGQYDAFMKALSKIYDKLDRSLPVLADYFVTIPPGGKTNALVETVITWYLDKEFKTRGLDSDQTASAIKATMRMLNLIETQLK